MKQVKQLLKLINWFLPKHWVFLTEDIKLNQAISNHYHININDIKMMWQLILTKSPRKSDPKWVDPFSGKVQRKTQCEKDKLPWTTEQFTVFLNRPSEVLVPLFSSSNQPPEKAERVGDLSI